MNKIKTDVVVIGAGPAGMLLTRLLLDLNYKVVLVEKQTNFDKEFRGEFLQPGVINVLKELDIFYKVEHLGEKIQEYNILDHGEKVLSYQFKEKQGYNIRQSKILPILFEECRKFDNFQYLDGYSLDDLILNSDDKIKGIEINSKNNKILKVYADLVVGSDGRTSKLSKLMKVSKDTAPFEMDVLWIKIPKPEKWDKKIELRIHSEGYLVLMPSYPDMLQLGINLKKGGIKDLKNKYGDISNLVDVLADVIPEAEKALRARINKWSDFEPLSVSGTLCKEWSRDNCILIGDAAHTVGPMAGQGINQAMKDAIFLYKLIKKFGLEKAVLNEKLDCLKQTRFNEVANLHELQLQQEKLLSMSGEEGIKNRKIVYGRIMNSSNPELTNMITMSDLSIKGGI